MGGINYFLYLKSRKTFSSMGLMPSKMAKMPKSRVFGAKRNVSDGVGGGIRPPKNFIFEILLFWPYRWVTLAFIRHPH